MAEDNEPDGVPGKGNTATKQHDSFEWVTLITAVVGIFILMVYTGLTAYLAWTAGDTEDRQLRAYVGLVGKGVDNFGTSFPVSVDFSAKNYGQTPAFNTSFKGWVGIAPYPLPSDSNIIISNANDISKVTLFPAAGFDGYTEAVALLTVNDIAAITDGHKTRMYIIEIVTYKDTFGKPHWTRMCASIGGKALVRVIHESAAARGGGVIGDFFEYCNRYNDTDDLQRH